MIKTTAAVEFDELEELVESDEFVETLELTVFTFLMGKRSNLTELAISR